MERVKVKLDWNEGDVHVQFECEGDVHVQFECVIDVGSSKGPRI